MKKLSIPFISKCFFAAEHFNNTDKNILLVLPDEESALKSYKQIQFYLSDSGKTEIDLQDSVLYFPSLDTIPYDRVSPSANIQAERARILTRLSYLGNKSLVITAAQNLIVKVPPKEIFANNILSLSVGDTTSLEEIAIFLVKSGYSRSPTAIDTGEFAMRGEILDFVSPTGIAYRIHFGWEKIESIKEYDISTQITNKNVEQVTISTVSESILNAKTIINFKNNFLQIFGVNYTNNPLYESIIAGNKFQGYEHLTPLFFEEMTSLLKFVENYQVIYDNLSLQSINECLASYEDLYQSRLETNKINPESYYFALPIDRYLEDENTVIESLKDGDNIFIEQDENKYQTYQTIEKISTTAIAEKKSVIDKLLEIIIANKNKTPIIFCNSISSRERIKLMIEEREYVCKSIDSLKAAKKNLVNLTVTPLSGGFITDKYLLISEQDVFGDKFTTQSHKSSPRKLKDILTEIDNLNEGELIIHRDHGIGRFDSISTIMVEDIPHDCLKIIYAENDILYLPVENIDVISKYGYSEAALDKLGGSAWQRRRAKAKKRITEIADKLMQITAERSLEKSSPIQFDPVSYEEFCNKFPYTETNDQLNAIGDVLQDLRSTKLMDRLICGDVGFGKTEVAMRTAFMVACDASEDTPQVVIISPTTILCRQHYESFKERFQGLGLKIVQLSRLVKSADIKKNKEAIKNGSASIIIGTHAILAKDVHFKNLRLIIIDEEQHFGVAQKERLKELKVGVHVMSLSATPIPRTLQMSMIGIKDLSLIATPPIDRLPVRTSVLPFDSVVIRDALMREKFRGGRSFYVAPRIKDIESLEKKLQQIVPELKFKVAHGQMPAAKIDEIMNDFCDGKFDILLSTTIIESGIDIPAANTIIIHKSDILGLSQLYQLRGRVGRGKVRGYAYLTLEQRKVITKHSMQRLEILQNIDSLGAGFSIASHDMDLRGFGNLVGEEQSGHIKEVGTELYQDMLEEAINQAKESQDTKKTQEFTPSINLGIAVYIPALYIEDASLRLAIYRRIGNLKTIDEIAHFHDEMIDRFGLLPPEFINLLEVVKIKLICYELGIESIDSGPNGFVFKFNEEFDVADLVMNFIKKHPRHAKIKPDNKMVFVHKIDKETVIAKTNEILEEFKIYT